MPKEFIAVVRPKNIVVKKRGQQTTGSRTDQQSIVPDEMEMNLEVKLYDFAPPEADVLKAGKVTKVVYSGKTTATTKQDVQGLYCFNTSGNELEHLCTQIGTYMFHFSLVSKKYGEVPPAVVRVNVAPSNTNMCNAHCLEKASDRKRRRRKSKSGSVGGSIDVAPVAAEDQEAEEEENPEPKIDITHVHVTTLDEVVSVNGFFAIAVFLGLAFSPPLPQNQAATTLAPPRLECYVQVNVYRAVVLWEVVSFGCFLFSTLVAHGFKLFIVLENGRDKENSKFAEVNRNFLRFGILASGVGSILGAIFLIVSMVVLIEIRLGDLTCGNPWAVKTTVPFVILGVSGCAIFIVAVFYESFIY
ncbi:hypothetical protein KC19_10G013300 [Ceratodon purpureus]|nr:hypothetical protein KC19_10G013300 [Ceratodon purpureus]